VAHAAVLLLLLAPGGDRVDFGTTAARRVRLLRHENPAVRARAAMLLAHAEPDEAIAALLVAVSDPHRNVRYAAAEALQALADERAVPVLAERLRTEGSSQVLTALLVALGRSGGAYVARRVVPYLEHPAREVRSAAAAALGHIGDAGQRAALWAALRYAPDDPGFAVRAAVLAAFVNLGWYEDVRRAVTELEEMGARRHWLGRAAILAAIGAAGIKEKTAWVRAQVTEDEDPRVVAAAAGALARLGRRDEVYALVGHRSPAVRRAALVALQDSGDPRAVARALVLVREDPDVAVRFEAALVLHHAERPEADVYLVDALRSRNPIFWITALGALEARHDRSFGRDADAWAEYLKQKRMSARPR
jgi:HEAT repeat protein